MNSNDTAIHAATGVGRPAWADFTGLIASIGCAVHCAAMPIVIGYLPSLGLDWLATQGFHQSMAVICSCIAVAAFFPGWRKHKKLMPTMLAVVGIGLITSHAFAGEDCCAAEAGGVAAPACESCAVCESGEQALLSPGDTETKTLSANSDEPAQATLFGRLITPVGGLFLICAHLLNHRLACGCCRGKSCGKDG